MPGQAGEARVAQLSRDIIDEILIAVGLPAHGWVRKLVEPFLWPPAERFSRIADRFDQAVGQSGLCEAARIILPEFVTGFEARGADNVPNSGPLLIASNHPGAYDGLVIAGSLHRDDLKMVVSGVPFTKALPNAARVFIYATHDPHERMEIIRTCIRHLQSGGSLLIFPSGVVDPDPAFLPGANQALDHWSRSLEIMLRKAPQTCLVTTIASGVLSPKIYKHPITRLRKGWQQRKLAEVIQIVGQMVFKRKFDLTPRVIFGRPFSTEEMIAGPRSTRMMEVIIESANQTLKASYAG